MILKIFSHRVSTCLRSRADALRASAEARTTRTVPLNTDYTLHAERYTRMRVRISALKREDGRSV